MTVWYDSTHFVQGRIYGGALGARAPPWFREKIDGGPDDVVKCYIKIGPPKTASHACDGIMEWAQGRI